MKFERVTCSALLVCLVLAALPDLALAQVAGQQDGDIVVTGSLTPREQQVKNLSKVISQRPRTDKPVARQYREMCVAVTGLSADMGQQFLDRIASNALRLNLSFGKPGCVANSVIIFTNDGKGQIEKLRKEGNWAFEPLFDYEYKRIFRGSGAAQVWHTTGVVGRDGREFSIMRMPDGSEVALNKSPSTTRLNDQIRTEIEGTVIIIDAKRSIGKTIPQLADYASMRLFASVDDVETVPDGSVPTILSLFAPQPFAPDGMTEFDWSYLTGLYRLPETAKGTAVHDAAVAAYRKAERAASEATQK